MRWFVGDLQGCVRELEQLLREVRFEVGRDELWSVGDVVNRGPESLETLRLWHELGGRGVIGNHDIYALRVAAGRAARKGVDTLGPVLESPDADRLLGALRSLPVLQHLPARGDGHDVWLVHAGLHPQWNDLHTLARDLESAPHDDIWLLRPEVRFATRVRCCDADGALLRFAGPPAACPPPFRPWDDFYTGEALVVHGHWAQRGFHRTERVLGLDSGCVYGGPLTAWCQDEDRIVQVPAQTRTR